MGPSALLPVSSASKTTRPVGRGRAVEFPGVLRSAEAARGSLVVRSLGTLAFGSSSCGGSCSVERLKGSSSVLRSSLIDVTIENSGDVGVLSHSGAGAPTLIQRKRLRR